MLSAGKLLAFSSLFLAIIHQFAAIQNLHSDWSAKPPSRSGGLTMCYVIERNTTDVTYDYNRAAAALDLARTYANGYILPPELQLTSFYREAGQTAGMSHILATAFQLRDAGIFCDVYIGPGSGRTVETIYDVVKIWDNPIIGCPASGLGQNAPASSYKIVSRTSVTYVGITNVLVRFFRTFNYTTPVIFQDQSFVLFQQLGVIMQATILDHSDLRYGAKFVPFESAHFSSASMKAWMRKSTLSSRVFVICAAGGVVRSFVLWARELRLTDGDYVFIAIELYRSDVWGSYSWKRHDEKDLEANQAYRSLLILSFNSDIANSGLTFWTDIVKLSREKYHYEFSPGQQDSLDPVVAHYYESVLLYANIVKSMAALDLDYRSGLAFTQHVANYTFVSPVTGLVRFNGDSDRLIDYAFRMYNEKNKKHEYTLAYTGDSPVVHYLGALDWLGQSRLPPNTPRCGFRGANPICAVQPFRLLPSMHAAISIAVIIVVVGIILYIYYIARRAINGHLDPFWWRIYDRDLAINLATHDHFEKEETKNEKDLYTMTSGLTATYRNITVSLIELPEPHLPYPTGMSRVTMSIESLHHNNLQKFIGVSVNSENLCCYIAGEICERGSLQHVLADPRIDLDSEFKYSFLKDLANGMIYLHSSLLRSHGFLNDTTCFLDSRFVLKIGQYGLSCLQPKNDFEAYHPTQAEHRNLRILLWRAPELLRKHMPVAGTQKGDIFSFGILTQEIILRADPYQKVSHELVRKKVTVSAEDILQEVCRGVMPPLRPQVPQHACPPAIHELMEQCWQEDPMSRPNFSRIRHIIHRAVQRAGDNLSDHLMSRMAAYTTELEIQASNKMREFMEERERSREILQEILPRAVADALSHGHHVRPVTFPSTTVYFGSVMGFKEAANTARSPLETVKMLNDLYGVCDAVIGRLDVFKVEAVIDNHLVVSGLPVENGIQHVENIAVMSLLLRTAVDSFRIATDAHFQLRAGINSGPCVAGVVGLKMPRYCLFGDTVNTASRMESHGEAGKIHVSDSSKALLDLIGHFVLTDRGITYLKGKGEMETFWLQYKAQPDS